MEIRKFILIFLLSTFVFFLCLALNNKGESGNSKTSNATSIEECGITAGDKSRALFNTLKMRKCVNSIHNNGGGNLIVPEKTYYFAVNNGYVFTVESNITLEGLSRVNSVIEMVSPSDRYYSAFSVKDGGKITNLTIKDDITNNQQPSSVNIGGADNPQALIQVAGKNIVLDRVDLYNSSTWAVYADDSAKISPRKDNFTMTNCRNFWRKRAWYTTVFDVSQVYSVLNTMTLENNKFYTDSPEYSRTVFDLAGTNIVVKHNYTSNYVQPLLLTHRTWVKEAVKDRQNYVIKGNYFENCKIGVMLFPTVGKTMNNILISDNKIVIDININSVQWDKEGNLVSGITVEPSFKGTIKNLKIQNNNISWVNKVEIKTQMALISGIGLFNGSMGGFNLYDCSINNNTIRGFPSVGISLGSMKTSALYATQNVKIFRNTLIDNGNYNNTTNGKNPLDEVYTSFYYSHIMLVPNGLENVDVSNNLIIDTGLISTKGAYYLTFLEVGNNYKNVHIGYNPVRVKVGSLGTNIDKRVINSGTPLNYIQSEKLNLLKKAVLKYPIRYSPSGKLDYNFQDFYLTRTGLYKDETFESPGVLTGVRIVGIRNKGVMEVNDASELRAGNVITWGSGSSLRIARIDFVKGNFVKFSGTNIIIDNIGNNVAFYEGL
ncbi:hypothetical protein [Peribacillus simplex]|uniref:hypothetical protein n=1 Tax=Peribacillus simplex TaxID=1478 RepID=UPI0024BF55AB|nr:hypothetical protein [Peribacillus simplex]WHY96087.1 hypothetical protein QNH37_19140 [Peribacillus simplex]